MDMIGVAAVPKQDSHGIFLGPQISHHVSPQKCHVTRGDTFPRASDVPSMVVLHVEALAQTLAAEVKRTKSCGPAPAEGYS